MCQSERALAPLFLEAKSSSMPRDMAYLAGRDCQPDDNLNFMGDSYDSNENCCQATAGLLRPGGGGEQLGDNASKVMRGDNASKVMRGRQKARSKSRVVPQGLRFDGMSLASEEEEEDEEEEEEEEEEAIRRPPEGAEVSGLEPENISIEERIKESEKLATSPLEDNGYASSSLSIDSPDSGGTPTAAAAGEDWRGHSESLFPGGATEPEDSSPSSETLFPALAEAFRNLQDKKMFKEREKEKHHIHLVMYRRLALLRWIRSLQQKVVDQQNRLQESFDTILDNRKELIRCVQQGMLGPKTPAQVEL